MRTTLICMIAATVLASGMAAAHHSPIVFDHTRKVAITGKVTEFKWGNPHSWIHLDVKDEQGAVGNWVVEMNPANNLARDGWRASTVRPGDVVTVTVFPLRNHEKGGQFISIKLPDGKILGDLGPGVL